METAVSKYTLIIAYKLGIKGYFFCKAEDQETTYQSLETTGWKVEHVLVDENQSAAQKPSERAKKELEGNTSIYAAHENDFTKITAKPFGGGVEKDYICRKQDVDAVFAVLTTTQRLEVTGISDVEKISEQCKFWLIAFPFYPLLLDTQKLKRKGW